MEAAFTVLDQYGKFSNIEDELKSLIPAKVQTFYDILSKAIDYSYKDKAINFSDILNMIRNNNLDDAYFHIKKASEGRSEGALLYVSDDSKKLKSTLEYKSPDDLKILFPKAITDLESRTGYDLLTYKAKIKDAKTSIAQFHKIYDELIEMDPSNPSLNVKHNENQEWIKTAESFLSSIQNFFGIKTSTTNPKTEVKTEAEEWSFMGLFYNNKKQDKSTKSAETKSDDAPSWKFSLDPSKWFNQFIASTDDADSASQNEQAEGDANNEYTLGSDFVRDEIHSYHQSLVQYGVTAAKAACFAPVIAGLKHTSETCAIERTKQASAKFTASEEINDYVNEESENTVSALVTTENTKTLIQSGNNDQKYTNKNCEDLIEEFYTLAENCNDIFWMDTTIDASIEQALNDAVLTKAKINDNGSLVLVSSDGLEIEMTSPTEEFGNDQLNQMLEYAGSDTSTNTLEIEA